MSLYCRIYVKASPALLTESLPDGSIVKPVDPYEAEEECPTATYVVESLRTYYSPGYRRGHWPTIHGLLAYLLANPHVSAVWYGSDFGYLLEPMTAEKLLRYSADYNWRPGKLFVSTYGAGKTDSYLRSLGLL